MDADAGASCSSTDTEEPELLEALLPFLLEPVLLDLLTHSSSSEGKQVFRELHTWMVPCERNRAWIWKEFLLICFIQVTRLGFVQFKRQDWVLFG